MTEKTVADTAVAPLVGSLPPHCQRDVDTLRRFVHTSVSQGSPAAPVSPVDFREVLLTGATGFIGRFLLHDLLQQHADLIVHCVVRADHAEHGFERLRDALQHAEVWDEEFAPRIRVVVGDIAEVRFGLSEADFAALCQRIDAVYHFAAEISLATSYTAIRKLNTLSIRNVLELCLRTRFKHLFYASTMGVFPQYIFAFAHEFKRSSIDHQMQPDLTEMKRRFPIGLLGYSWSKLTSEQGLLFAQQAGMPLAIFRLPHTNISSTGFVRASDLAVNIFAAVLEAETMPEEFTFRSAHDESVDTLSRACTAISLNPRRRFTIYHCCNPQLDTYELELADFGTYLPEVPYESFKRVCQASESSPLNGHWAVLDHFAKYWFSQDKPKDRLPISDRALREDCPHPINWPGVFTKLRHSYRWVMAHPWQWPHPISYGRLDFNCLLTRAERYAEDHGVSFDRAYPTWLRRNLEQLVRAVNASDFMKLEENLPGVIYDFSRLLRNNAAFARERRQRPEIEREEITCPVFIVGINRTGTTFLHRLLARDERFWAPRVYEYAAPILSKEAYATIGGTPEDPRRAHVKERLGSSEVRERFKGVHDFDIDEPAEDFPILEMVFGSWTSTVRFRIPEFGRWLEVNGTRHSYAHHRRIMQHLTWQRRQRQLQHQGQWLFKMPIHLMELENLVQTYPDALFIQTHRSPVQFMGSWNSFVERARSIISDPQSRESLGAEQLDFMSGMMDRGVRFRENHPELEHRWMDVNYVDLIEDPFGVVRSIYKHFGWTLEQAAIDAMEDWQFRQAEQRRQEKRHRYDLQDYGLTPEKVTAAFARYRDFITTRGIRSSRS
ncbi:MAG: SDR family oxidoreductase [Gemmatimonadetes bacterium]|nr:SDR family oxidoreductase [Gemmatimonadota bacterium]